MLVECGFTRAQTSDGREWTFVPSLGRIAALGSPQEIVRLYAELHGPRAAEGAAYVLAVLCDQEDVTPLTGWLDEALVRHPGAMPEAEQILVARHLMQHGIVGRARPEKGDGRYVGRFDAAEFVALAVAHLGMSPEAAEALSMTELQLALEAKFPELAKKRDVPTREEYRAFMEKMKEQGRG